MPPDGPALGPAGGRLHGVILHAQLPGAGRSRGKRSSHPQSREKGREVGTKAVGARERIAFERNTTEAGQQRHTERSTD